VTVAIRRRAIDWGPPLLVFALGILSWQLLVVAFNVQEFLLPKPTEIARTLWDERSSLWHAGIYTFKEALGGFAIGSSLAIAVSLVFAAFRSGPRSCPSRSRRTPCRSSPSRRS
jgi:NitT/TauT family transport system permease protein